MMNLNPVPETLNPTIKHNSSVTILIPAYNEEEGIGFTLQEFQRVAKGKSWEIMVVNDGSTDKTLEKILEFPEIKVISHKINRGYGASLKTGILAAKTDTIVILDADRQHVLPDIDRLLEASTDYEMVVGVRQQLMHSPAWRMPGKWVLWILANYLTNTKIPDLNSGFRVFKRNFVLKYLQLCPDGFSFTTTITIAALSGRHSVNYVPIQVYKRTGTSKANVMDGIRTFMLILRLITLFDPLRIFLTASLFLMGLGALWGIPYALQGRGLSIGSLLLIITGIIVFFFGLLADQISAIRKSNL